MASANDLEEYVLFVDDDPDILEIYESMMATHHFKALFAKDADDAIRCITSQPIYYVVSDMKMPDVDGASLCLKIREMGNLVPFLLLTGYADKTTAVEGLRAGATDMVEKPISEAALIERLSQRRQDRFREIEDERRERAELKAMFLEEARDILGDLDKSILCLEEEPIDYAEVNALYRKVHTVKGSAAAADGTDDFRNLAHAFESVLTKLKDGSLQPNQDLIDVMLESADNLNAHIAALESGDEEKPPVDDLVKSLMSFLEGAGAKVPAPSTKKKRPGPAPKVEDKDDGVLVSNEKLDGFMSVAGELVAFKNIFQGFIRNSAFSDGEKKNDADELEKMLTKISDQIQAQIMEVRKVGLGKTFAKYPRVVRQIAAEQGKQIELEIVGQEIAVDKTIAKALGSSLIHAVRNACDHGIESTDVRAKVGKPLRGKVTLTAEERSGVTYITLSDDGGGINRDRVAKKAIAQGLVDASAAAALSNEEVFNYIFAPGFSTAEKVTDISGRGVGMDVVRTSITSVGGRVHLDSKEGTGTEMFIEIPVPKSVMVEQSVIATSGDVHLAVPLTSIAEIRRPTEKQLTLVQDCWTTQYQSKTIPVGTFGEFLCSKYDLEMKVDGQLLLVLKYKDDHIGLRVEGISEQVQTVIRPFDPITKKIEGFDGVTILSDNSIAYVISAEQMVSAALNKAVEIDKAS